MLEKFRSRKFIAAFCGALFPPILAYLGQEIALTEALELSAIVIVSYIFGQAYQDGKALEGVAPDA